MNDTKFCAAYIRVSTDKQEELSPASQLKELKNYAAEHNYILLPEYTFMEQEGVSGKRADKRPAFQNMIATAKLKPKPFDAILVWKFSRFARNQDEAAFYKGTLRKKYGIDVISISEPIIEGMYGRLIEMIIEWNDEFYSYNLSGEVMRGMKEKANRSGYQAQPPFGYTSIDGVPTPDEDAHLVKSIFDDYLKGKSQYCISKELNDKGYKTKKGNGFQMRTITYILENPFYTGKIRWNRQHHESNSIKDESEWIITPGVHEALISDEIFQQVKEQLVIRKRKCTRSKAYGTHWLTSMLVCSTCGKKLATLYQGKNHDRYWQCHGYNHGSCTVSHCIKSKKIELAIIENLRNVLSTDDLQYKLNIKNTDSSKNNQELLQKSLESLSKKEMRIKKAYMNGIDTLEEYKEMKAILDNERTSIEQKLSELTKNVTSVEEYKKTVSNVCDILEDENTTIEEKSNALKSVVDYIIYDKATESIDIHLVKYQ